MRIIIEFHNSHDAQQHCAMLPQCLLPLHHDHNYDYHDNDNHHVDHQQRHNYNNLIDDDNDNLS
jgi:hypothetical protein